MKRARALTVKMVVESPDGRRKNVARLPAGVALAAARGIIRETHFDVTLIGEYGEARFDLNGHHGQVRTQYQRVSVLRRPLNDHQRTVRLR